MVHDLTRVIADCGGNIVESRMSALGSEFAMALLMSGNWHSLARSNPNSASWPRLARSRAPATHRGARRRTDMLPYSVDIVCLDQSGIVSSVSGFFAARGIDIGELDTRSYPAAHTGAPMFALQLTINVPAASPGALREEFMDFCDNMNLDAILEPVKNVSAPALDREVANFSLPSSSGKTFRLRGAGAPLVLYFYPRDNTPGCTREGEAFLAACPPSGAARPRVGVSRDNVSSHQRFWKLRPAVRAAGRRRRSRCRRFDVIHEKNMYGRKVLGIERSTFLLDAAGELRREWRKVKVDGHAADVLEAVGEL